MFSNSIGAIGYIAMAVAANNLFRAVEDSVPRGRRRVILAALLAGAVLQMSLQLAGLLRPSALAAGLEILASACLAGS
jgi:hypothetical protein